MRCGWPISPRIAVGTPITERPPQSGRVEARIGPIPTSPRPSLSFRTAGFPPVRLEGWPVRWGLPRCRPLKPAPGIRQPAPGLRPPFAHLVVNFGVPALCRAEDSIVHRHGGWGNPPPQGPSLRSGLCCPGLSSLNRPHPPHSQAHRDFTAGRLIRDAFAVREHRGDPRVVPSFRCPFRPGMPSSLTPGSSVIERVQSLDADTGLRRDLSGSALPTIPQSVSRGARFRGFLGSPSLRPARLLAPLVRI